MPNSEADAIVLNVQNQLETHGRNAEAHAYTTLLDEVQRYQATHTQCENNQLTNKLEESGLLPQLAVGWLQNDFDKINIDRNDYGLTKAEIALHTQSNGSVKSDIDAMLANQLLAPGERGRAQYDDVAKRNWLGADPELIEKADLRAYDRQHTRERNRKERHEGVRDVAAPLFEGSPPLMAILDASHNGKCDGRVSERDMRRFLTQYEVNNKTDNAGNSPYTPENAAYVSDLLDGKYPELTGPNFTGFSARALARRAGIQHVSINSIEDYATLVDVYSSKSGRYEPQEETNEPTRPIEDECNPPRVEPCVEEDPHARTLSKVHDLSVYNKGEGQWHVAKRLLNSNEGGIAATNEEIWKLTKDIMSVDGTKTLDSKGRSRPIVHPGDVAPVAENLDKLVLKNPKLADLIQ